MVTKSEYLHLHVCVMLHMWRPAGRKTRGGTLTHGTYVSGEVIANFFGSWFSDVNAIRQQKRSAQMWRRLRNVHVLLHVRVEAAQSLGDDTRAVV